MLMSENGRYITRQISEYILKVAGMYPVVTVCGPRQSGKTTLVRHLFSQYDYVNMEIPHHRLEFETDALSFLAKHPAPCIFDEVQYTPQLLSYLQGIVDDDTRNGMYILTGSRQMELQQEVTQSLAGRTAMVDLLPLSVDELRRAGICLGRDESILYGGLPRIHGGVLDPSIAYQDYLRTYVERDARKIIHLHKLKEFEMFIQLLAARVGQVINYSSLANDVGVSMPTIREWVSVLEASYIIFTLYPYHSNFGKRLIKSPKIYFTETGLAASLLGLDTPDQVLRDPLVGNLFENLIVSEILKSYLNCGKRPRLSFFRDSNGLEVDLILDHQRCPIPIEIKSSRTCNSSLCRNLRLFKRIAPMALSPTLIYGGDAPVSLQDVVALPFYQASYCIQ